MAILGKSKVCPFKEDAKLVKKINYKEYKFLKKFITDQGKIIPAHVTGVSAKYQRMITKEVKKARILALLPFVVDPRQN
jgi:small subunit ribosomal protein S18